MSQLRVILFGLLAACSAAGQNYLINQFAGGGLPQSGPGTSADLNGASIYGIAADAAGNLYFPFQCAVIWWDAATGLLSLVAGSEMPGYSGDNGPAVGARLFYPRVALDSAGNIYIADSYNNRVRKVSNGLITTVAGDGTPGYGGDNGPATAAMLNFPAGVVVDSHNNVYIADQDNHRVRLVSSGTITTVAGNGQAGYNGDNMPATAAMLNFPVSVAVNPAGDVYIADANNNRVRMVSGGTIATVAGIGTAGFNGDNISATAAELNAPYGVATDTAGNLYIADMDNCRVRMVSGLMISTVAGNGHQSYSGDSGSAVNAGLVPYAVAFNAGNLYIADYNGARLRRVTGSQINSVVGGGSPPNGVYPMGTMLAYPLGLAVNRSGNLFIADSGNNLVWQVSNGKISTVAGTGVAGYGGDQNSATKAMLNSPMGVAVDSAGVLYIVDTYNYVIRQVAGGVITTVTGNGTPGFKDNVSATSAQFNRPWGIALDSTGSIAYIADVGNQRIRKITNNIVTTVAGNGTTGYSGDGGAATGASLNNPAGVAVDSTGVLYIADAGNSVIRKVSGGNITTFAGGGTLSGDNIQATSAKLSQPWGVAVDSNGAVYIAEYYYPPHIRKVVGGVITTIAGGGDDFGVDAPGASVRIDNPTSVTVDSSSNVYFGGWGLGAVFSLSPYTPSLLSASLSHTGDFAPGQNGATYTVTVSNGASGGATTGQVSVTESVPAGLTLVSMSGTGWVCVLGGECLRSDPLQPGSSYPPITVTVNVAPDASSPLVNSVTVTGGGSITATATDSTLIGSFTEVTIQTIPPGLQFTVDGGSLQSAPQTLSLSRGSHSIAVNPNQGSVPGTRHWFVQWSDGCQTVSDTITVGSSPATYTATLATQHNLTISASPAAGGSFKPFSGSWYDDGTVVPITAAPNAGYRFTGWSGPVADPSSASTTVTMSAAQTLTANFTALTPITVQTNPTGLQFSIDGQAAQTAPQTVYLAAGSHTLAVAATQPGTPGTQYIFSSWSDGGAVSHTILVGTSTATYTATFNPQYGVSVTILPAGAGTVTETLSRNGYFNPGTVVTLTATANTGYQFLNWSGDLSGSANPHTITMDGPHSVTANFSSLTGITIQTNPTALQIVVDNVTYTAPQILSLSAGSHIIAVPTTQAGGTGTQYVFSAWSDSGAASHTINVTGSPATYTATFTTQFQLTTAVSPSGTGSVVASPSSSGYYNAGAIVQLTASANAGYQFSSWSGALNGSTNSQSITMDAPHSVTANFAAIASTCTLAVSPPGISLPATGTSTVETCPNNSGQPNCGVQPEVTQSFTVTPSPACGRWTAASSNPEFLQVTSGSVGTGTGTVSFALLNNTHTVPQNYNIRVFSQDPYGSWASTPYTVTQAGSGDSQVYREVYALYEQLLGRDPDPPGFAFWTGAGGASLGQMADSFLTSPEAFNTDFAVMAVFQAASGALPNSAQFSAGLADLRGGSTVAELFDAMSGGLSCSQPPCQYTATQLYQNLLNRQPTAAEIASANKAGLINWFQTLIGYPGSVTPISTANNESQSTGSFHVDHTNALYVQMIYFVTMSRDPDPAGFNFWLGIANSGGAGLLFQGAGGYSTRIQILGPGTPNQGFIGSPEFQNLFAN